MDTRILKCFDHHDYAFYTKEFQKDEVMIHPLHQNRELMFIVEGKIGVYTLKEDGSIQFVSINEGFTMLGDLEFVIGDYPIFFVEAKSNVKVVCLNIDQEYNKLHHDITFLHYVNSLLAEKIKLSTTNQFTMPSIEERLLVYMENHQNTLQHIEQVSNYLQCSKRQLQRIIKKLLEEEKIKKVKKGVYILL